MPKAILEFSLPDEEQEHRNALNAGMIIFALIELDQFLRKDIKYADGKLSSEEIRKELHAICDSCGVSL